MHEMWNNMKTEINRRSFMKNGITAAGVGLLANSSSVFANRGLKNAVEVSPREMRL